MEKRLPYMGALELTYRCNLNCCHCFCNLPAGHPKKREELTLVEIKRLLDEMAGAGCLWLLVTGGEALLREDFLEIYDHALDRGMFLEIFTNATLITQKIAERFAKRPPLGIEISIYGASAAVHDNVTRVPGSFDKVINGIELLKENHVPFSLKTMAMTLNVNELANMQRLADSLGVEFKFDCFICSRLDGDTSALNYRLSISKVIELELGSQENIAVYHDLFSSFWKKGLDNAYICSAGINSFNVNPYGYLSPCTMYSSFQHSLRDKDFQGAWQKLVKNYGFGPNGFLSAGCKSCSMVSICPSCPAWAELETRKLDSCVDYLCCYALTLEKTFLDEIKKACLPAGREEKNGEKALSKTGN
jgi:radical SAM protein with 4Fe4S-binding SPASM domain